MTSRIRNGKWKEDEELRHDIERLVGASWQKKEVLDEMERLYPQYAWSLRTLGLRMQHFGVKYIDNNVDLNDVRNAVEEELKVTCFFLFDRPFLKTGPIELAMSVLSV